jgi:hypothetical protein
VTSALRGWHATRLALLFVGAQLLGLAPAHAHLMTAQRGTLNFVGNAAFMVLSVPVSALQGVDDDGDGALSKTELETHVDAIREQVKTGVQLQGPDGPMPLQLMMLDTVPAENAPAAAASHLLVLGRFALDAPASAWRFSLRLFGTRAEEQTEQITVTRGVETQAMTLTPGHSEKGVLPSSGSVFAEQVRLGATHVLSGADHLLFLLVVLSTGWSLRSIVLALTSFTVGHAFTLMACAWWGLAVPSALVEPAIAATIVGMALFDRWSQGDALRQRTAVRMALVFLCALIHGLGLAGALANLGLDPSRKALSLVGFNLGIEIGQLSVAVVAHLLVKIVQSLRGPVALSITHQLTSYASLALGSFWFVERVVTAA